MLLKVVLFAYSQGLSSSRAIARACVRDATFIALSGDHQPRFTTFAHFISTLGDDIATVFGAVLAICQRQGLIGAELFAIDGVKLPSNASKHKSGTRADIERQATKLEATAKALLARYAAADAADAADAELDLSERRAEKVERLHRDAAALRHWLAAHPQDRRNASGNIVKRNRTDNDSAKKPPRYKPADFDYNHIAGTGDVARATTLLRLRCSDRSVTTAIQPLYGAVISEKATREIGMH